MASTVYSRALQKAAELMGSYDKLSRFLLVPSADLQRWISGKGTPPTAVFLKVVDYILDETQPPAGESEAGDPPAPHDAASAGDAPATRY